MTKNNRRTKRGVVTLLLALVLGVSSIASAQEAASPEMQFPEPMQEPATAQPLIPPMEQPSVVPDGVETPGQAGLAAPSIPAQSVSEIQVAPRQDQAVPDNIFYDAEALVPQTELAVKSPRKVNPATEPGSRLIVVKKDYSPGSLQAQLVSADRAVRLGRYDAALAIYDDLYPRNKRNAKVLLGRAVALQHVGQIDDAISAYEDLLDVDPANVDAHVNMLGLVGQRYPAVALRRLLDLSERNPRNVNVLAQAAVLEGRVGNYEQAARYIGKAAALQPQNAVHLFNLAVILDRAGKNDEAVKYYEQAVEIDTIYGGGRSIPREAVFERLAQLR